MDDFALRKQLVGNLEKTNAITRPPIGQAFRVVPRHLFVPDVDLVDAYQDDVIFTKSRDGISLSAASAPSIMAEMLELLDLRSGHRVLEIGAGTGYNAALMEEIVGPAGNVVTIDIDQDVVDAAVAHLRAAERGARITVRCGDGGLGWPEGGPYDRIIVTVGSWDLPPAWFQQLADGGRLVVPLEFQDVHKLVTFERHGMRLISVDVRDCRFVRPQGVLAGPEQQIPLAPGLYLSTSDADVRSAAVAGMLASGAVSGEPLPVDMTPEELHRAFRLWLALNAPDFCLVSLETQALLASSVRAWQVTAQRAVSAADENTSFASAPGLLSTQAICLLEPAANDDRRPVLRCYGEPGELMSRLRGLVRAWHDDGRPFATHLTIEATPVTAEPPAAVDGGCVTQKRWFRYLLRDSPSPTQDKYWYVSHTPQGVEQPVDRLIRAAENWEPCAGRVIDDVDFAWLAGLGAATPPRSETVHRSDDPVDVAHAVFDILNSSEYRRGPAEHLADIQDSLLPRVTARIAAGQPIRIVIPSFPGRPYNPITHQRVAPDLGEAFAFVLLSRISRHVATVYAPGVQFVICLDGTAYNPFYGYTNEADHQYPADLRRFVERLGVQDAVTIIDLQDLIDERKDQFLELVRQARNELAVDWNKPDYKFRDELIETMKMGTNTVALNAAAVYLIKYFDPRHDVTDLVTRMRAAVAGRARQTAFEYMAFMVAIRQMNLIETALPDAIRGTVHPKPDQYSPYLVGRATEIAPWHGVAVLRANGSIDTVYESEIFTEPARYTAVYLRGDYTPFYYEERTAGAPGEEP